MKSIDLSELDGLSSDLNALLKEAPEKRRELHEQLAEMAKQEVDTQITSSVNDVEKKISSWQEPHVGSGGGYAAVRAQSGATGADSPGAITNYLENGHKIRSPSGQVQHYRPAINTPFVNGRHFYEKSRSSVEAKAISLVEDFADKLAERMAGE